MSSDKLDKAVADARMARDQREKGYREQALKMYPWSPFVSLAVSL